jgi:hypothetical protein
MLALTSSLHPFAAASRHPEPCARGQVYKFEALRPMSLMLQQMDLPEEQPPGLLGRLFGSKCVACCVC